MSDARYQWQARAKGERVKRSKVQARGNADGGTGDMSSRPVVVEELQYEQRERRLVESQSDGVGGG